MSCLLSFPHAWLTVSMTSPKSNKKRKKKGNKKNNREEDSSSWRRMSVGWKCVSCGGHLSKGKLRARLLWRIRSSLGSRRTSWQGGRCSLLVRLCVFVRWKLNGNSSGAIATPFISVPPKTSPIHCPNMFPFFFCFSGHTWQHVREGLAPWPGSLADCLRFGVNNLPD